MHNGLSDDMRHNTFSDDALNNDTQRNHALNPIKKLVMAAMILHVASIFAVAVIIALQVPLRRLFMWNADDLFIFPSAIYLTAQTIVLVVHWILTLSFWQVVKPESIYNNGEESNRLKTLAILSFIFIIIVLPIILNVSSILDMRFLSFRGGIEYIASYSVLLTTMAYSFFLRSLGLSLFLIAAGMSYYYWHLNKNESSDY